jgi:GH25 family lysozyme M1 (1,4-beta-N-acetylmuramidase)
MALLDIVIDVSDAQHQIDWRRVAAAGIKVAMIKATQGTSFTAHTWAANSAGAKAAGIAVIPYHFLIEADPAAQAAHFNSVARLAPGAAYALDWETPPASQGRPASAAQAEAVGVTLTTTTARKPLGYFGIPGSTPKAPDGSLMTPTAVMQTWERWVPRFREGTISDFGKMPSKFTTPFGPRGEPSVPGNFLFWQYTDGGTVDGIAIDQPADKQNRTDRSVGSFDNATVMVAWVTGTTPVA